MKKFWIFFLFIGLLVVGMTGCSSSNDDSSAEEEDVETTSDAVEEEETDEEEEAAGDFVTIIIPASFEDDVQGMIEELEAAGATVEQNSDGGATAEIAQEDLDALLEKYHAEVMTMIEDLNSQASTGETSIKGLEYDEETFQEFNVTVDKAAYEASEGMDGFVLLGLALQSLRYQVYSGLDEADLQCTINIIDESTGETIETMVLPEQQ